MDFSVNERFMLVLERKHINQSDFAKEMGYGRANVSNWATAKQGIPLKAIIYLLNKYPDIDARWLLTGNVTYGNNENTEPTIIEETDLSRSKDRIIEIQDKYIKELEQKIKILSDKN